MKKMIMGILCFLFIIKAFPVWSATAPSEPSEDQTESVEKPPAIVIPESRGTRRVVTANTCFPNDIFLRLMVENNLKPGVQGHEMSISDMGMTLSGMMTVWFDSEQEYFIVTSTASMGYTCIISRGTTPTLNLSNIWSIGESEREKF